MSKDFVDSFNVIRVLIIAGPSIFCVGLMTVLRGEPDIEVIGTMQNTDNVIQAFNALSPDVAIVDFVPDLVSEELVAVLGRMRFNVIVMSDSQTSEDIHRTLMAGAKSYLLKNIQTDELLKAIREVKRGKTYIPHAAASKLAERMSLDDLTLRERQIAELMATGRTNSQIAKTLCVSVGTVKVHVRNIFSKLGVTNRSQAILEIFRQGIARLNTNQ